MNNTLWSYRTLIGAIGMAVGTLVFSIRVDAAADTSGKKVSTLRLLDSSIAPNLTATKSAVTILDEIEVGVLVRFRVCVDETGMPYDAQLISSPDEALGAQWLQYINETSFDPPRMMDNETCVAIRVDFELVSKSPTNWRMNLWDEKEFDELPRVPIDAAFEAFVAQADTEGKQGYRIRYATASMGKPEIETDEESFDKESDWAQRLKIEPAAFPRFKDTPVSFYVLGSLSIPDGSNDNLGSIAIYGPDISKYPRPIYMASPVYPPYYAMNGMVGKCVLDFVVDEKGNVAGSMVKSATLRGFAIAAQKSLERARFTPAEINYDKVKMKFRQEFIFDIPSKIGKTGSRIVRPSEAYFKLYPRYDEAPEVKNAEDVVYPIQALLGKHTGMVKVSAFINEEGIPSRILLVKSSENPEMDAAAEAAYSRFRFKPAMADGNPVVSSVSWTFKFDTDNLFEVDRDILRKMRKNKLVIVPADQLDSTPKPILKAEPEPIRIASFAGTGGKTIISAMIDENGYVRFPEITETTDLAYGYTAAAAVAKWRFSVPRKNGKAVITKVQLPFEF